MPRMPGAEWVGEQSPRVPMSAYDIVCIHTIVGHPPAHAAHFSVYGSGRILQSRDTAFRSAANLDGNPRVIAIENEDMGPGFVWDGASGVPGFTAEQIEANAKILAWVHETHGTPLVLCPNSRPGSQGLAYHRQGIDGNFGDFQFPGRVPGGEVWTLSPGKICPGDKKIAARPVILEKAKTIGKDWLDMATEQELRQIIREELRAQIKPLKQAERERYRWLRKALDELADETDVTVLKRRLSALRQDLDALAEHVGSDEQ